MTGRHPTRPLTARGVERRGQLVACATRLFAEGGVNDTSITRIVNELGVGKGVFYWYFDSKEELLAEILASALADLRSSQRDGLARADDPLARIAEGLRASMRWYATHPREVGLFGWAETDARFAEQLRIGREVALSDIERHVRAAVSRGQIPSGHPAIRSEAVLGASLRLARGVVHRRGVDPAEVAEAAVRFCLAGLRAG